MKISALIAAHRTANQTLGTPVFADGIEDSNTTVQVIVPRACLTAEVIADIAADNTPFSCRVDTNADLVNLGETKAYQAVGTYGELEIRVQEISLPPLSELSSKVPDGLFAAVLLAYRATTGEIIFAEGSDPDGYRYHQITVDGAPSHECEAKDLCGQYGDVTVEIRYLSV